MTIEPPVPRQPKRPKRLVRTLLIGGLVGVAVFQSRRANIVGGGLSLSSPSCSYKKEASSALGDGCYHVFLDVGANMGE